LRKLSRKYKYIGDFHGDGKFRMIFAKNVAKIKVVGQKIFFRKNKISGNFAKILLLYKNENRHFCFYPKLKLLSSHYFRP
jgi:hypothetical protein